MSALLSFFGGKAGSTVALVLLTWGITSGYNWWGNFKDKQRFEAEKAQYEQAMMAYANAYDKADTILRSTEKTRQERREAVTNTITDIHEVSRNEQTNWGDQRIPDIYINSLRDAFQQAASINDESSSGGPITRLKRAVNREFFDQQAE